MKHATQGALFVAKKHLQYLVRDKETILWTFLMPPIFFWFIGTVTGGFDKGSGGPGGLGGESLYVEESAGGGFLQEEILRRVEEQNFKVVRAGAAAQAGAGEGLSAERAKPDPADYRRHLVFPPDFTAAALAPGSDPATVRFVRRGESSNTAEYERMRLARAVYTVLADLLVLQQEGRTIDSAAFAELAAEERMVQLEVRRAGERKRIPSGFEQSVPGTMVMFTMSVLLSGGAVMLVVERRNGLLRRLASAPLSRGSIAFGKWLGNMALGVLQLGFAILVGALAFGLDWGGDAFPAVLTILLLWGAFNAALALLLANLARTEAQVAGIATFASLSLAALGGCWWPIEIAPDWMQDLALALPTGWTMDAMHRLVSFGLGFADVLPHVLALAAATLAAGWAAARTFRYQ